MKSPEEQVKLTQFVAKIAKENEARVAWGTEALHAVVAVKGEEYTHNKKADDAGHVGPFGNFIYASCLYQAITKKSPVGHPLRKIKTTTWKVRFGDDISADSPVYETEIPEEDAQFIQKKVEEIQGKLSGS